MLTEADDRSRPEELLAQRAADLVDLVDDVRQEVVHRGAGEWHLLAGGDRIRPGKTAQVQGRPS
jgi:hypothetical protein